MSNSATLPMLEEQATVSLKQTILKTLKQTLLNMLKIEPSNDVILAQIGEVNEKLSEFDDAHDYYQQAIQINPQNRLAIKQLATLYHYQFDKPSKAEQYYIQYNNIHPNDDCIHLNLAKIYMKQRKYSQAGEAFERCDFQKAAVNYHFGVYLLGYDQCYDALKYFAQAIDINPTVTKYHLAHAKLCIKLTEYEHAKKSLLQANEQLECKDAEILFELALCFKHFFDYFWLPQHTSLAYINLALELKPNNVPYKYYRLKCQQSRSINDIFLRVVDGESSSCDNLIDTKIDLLVCGFVKNNLHVYIPSDIVPLIRIFFYGGYKQTSLGMYTNYVLTERGKQEMIAMFFDALCPGRDETKLIFTITKLCDYVKDTADRASVMLEYADEHQLDYDPDILACADYGIHCFILLKSILKFSNVYDALSIIKQTEGYCDYKWQLVRLCHSVDYFDGYIYNNCYQVSFLFQLFHDNDNFFTIYKSFEPRRVFQLYVKGNPEEYFTYPNLKYSRLIILQYRCNGHHELKNGIGAIKTLIHAIEHQTNVMSWDSIYTKSNDRSCVLLLLEAEIRCLNKEDLNHDHELVIALDQILYFIWDNIQFFLDATYWTHISIKSLVSIFEMFQKMNLNLKPSQMDCVNFFDGVSLVIESATTLKDKQLPQWMPFFKKIHGVMKDYCNKIKMEVSSICAISKMDERL